MKKIIRKLWNDIVSGENLDLYLTTLCAIVFSVLNLLGLDLGSRIAGATLAVLALLAIGNLVSRHKLDEVLREQYGTGLFKRSLPPTIRDDYEKANEIWIVGVNLTKTLESYSTLLEDHLAQGRKLRVILPNPDSGAIEYISKMFYYQATVENWKRRIQVSLDRLIQISEGHKNVLEIRLIDYPISFGIKGMNVDKPNGKLYISYYEYRSKIDGIRFILTTKDEHWYELYKSQLLALWEDAKPYNA